MQSPLPTLLLCAGYLVMCYMGPQTMAKRQPFELKPLILLYNFVMVILSAYMCYEVRKVVVEMQDLECLESLLL